MSTNDLWDAFISHASEDKDGLVRALSEALRAFGATIWYDEFSLKLGDFLMSSIDKGLAQSRYGIVVLSRHFISKRWPQRELQGLVGREVSGHSTILPIWRGIDRDEVMEFSPPLAAKVAVRTVGLSAQEIALHIFSVIRADLYGQTPHAELHERMSGRTLQRLQEELEEARTQLAEFQCPYCGSPLVSSDQLPLDREQRDWGLIRSFECGHMELDGGVQRPCPTDPNFPKLEEYEIQCRENPQQLTMFRWTCHAFARSVTAQGVPLQSTYGATKAEARAALQGRYEEVARPRWRRA